VAVSIAVVCEAPADQRTGCDLADRVFCRDVPWIEDAWLNHVRHWRGIGDNDQCLTWAEVKSLARSLGLRVHGHYQGVPATHDAHAATKALRLLLEMERPPDAVILLRDTDQDPNRRIGLEQARSASDLAGRIVIGLAHPTRECWVLVGFEPQDEQEIARLEELRNELGFDPTEKAQRLTGKRGVASNAKRVLSDLTADNHERQRDCWRTTALDVLVKRGGNVGLTDYLDEVRDRLIPLLTAHRRMVL
jgi:hypothetical protein